VSAVFRLAAAAAACATLPAFTIAAPAEAAARTAAVFPFEFIYSGEPDPTAKPDVEQARLRMVTELLRTRLTESGGYQPVEISAAEPAIAKAPALRDCQPCAEEIARGVGADIAVVSYIQKVSNLIINVNIRISDARSGQMLAAGSADIRGNTDESWSRGVEWLVKHRLLARRQP
jgi:hypothetical protein